MGEFAFVVRCAVTHCGVEMPRSWMWEGCWSESDGIRAARAIFIRRPVDRGALNDFRVERCVLCVWAGDCACVRFVDPNSFGITLGPRSARNCLVAVCPGDGGATLGSDEGRLLPLPTWQANWPLLTSAGIRGCDPQGWVGRCQEHPGGALSAIERKSSAAAIARPPIPGKRPVGRGLARPTLQARSGNARPGINRMMLAVLAAGHDAPTLWTG
jgi:hypothetical protein